MMTWERATSIHGPWVPVKRVPKTVLRKCQKKNYTSDWTLVLRYPPGDPIPAYRYFYRYSISDSASEL
jgi:hypothetical protein